MTRSRRPQRAGSHRRRPRAGRARPGAAVRRPRRSSSWWSPSPACVGLYELTGALATVRRRLPLVPLARRRGRHALAGVAPHGADDMVVAFLLTVAGGVRLAAARGRRGLPARHRGRRRSPWSTCRSWPRSPCCWRCPSDGARRVVAFAATVACSDIGGYAAGVLFGKHPMAPTISPKKSWEGFAGSVIACIGRRAADCVHRAAARRAGGRACCSGWRSSSARPSATWASR